MYVNATYRLQELNLVIKFSKFGIAKTIPCQKTLLMALSISEGKFGILF